MSPDNFYQITRYPSIVKTVFTSVIATGAIRQAADYDDADAGHVGHRQD